MSQTMRTIQQVNTENLFLELCTIERLTQGFKAVKKNRGSPGIDGITTEEFSSRLEEELSQLQMELERWSYSPQPVRRVEIPKPQGGTRLLGIPCVRDRVVQAATKQLLEPILDPLFSNSSFGFRPGRNQEQAIAMAKGHIMNGKAFVVDIDLEKFFDRIHHDRLISRLSDFISDKRILRLVGLTLRSGVMVDGLIMSSSEGSVQGSPLSPLLSNVVLDELDQALEERGYKFCRFADDCNIFARGPEEAERIMAEVSKFIEKRLRLAVNRKKSQVAESKHVKFLGMTILENGTVTISAQSMERAKQKLNELTRRRTHLPMDKAIEQINQWYVGWSNYYGMTQHRGQMAYLEGHTRRRLRARLIRQTKKRRHLFRKLLKLGVSRPLAGSAINSNKGIWSLSHHPGVERAYPNKWFTETLGLKQKSQETSRFRPAKRRYGVGRKKL